MTVTNALARHGVVAPDAHLCVIRVRLGARRTSSHGFGFGLPGRSRKPRQTASLCKFAPILSGSSGYVPSRSVRRGGCYRHDLRWLSGELFFRHFKCAALHREANGRQGRALTGLALSGRAARVVVAHSPTLGCNRCRLVVTLRSQPVRRNARGNAFAFARVERRSECGR